MDFLIRKWLVPHTLRGIYDVEVLDNLSKVNIFIGPNNSGKSMFMRGLANLEKEMISPTGYNQDELLNTMHEVRALFKKLMDMSPTGEIEEIFSNVFNDSLIPSSYLETNKQHAVNIDTFLFTLEEIKKLNFNPEPVGNIKGLVYSYIDQHRGSLEEYIDILKGFKSKFRDEYKFYKLYIPTLRGLRPSNQHPLFYDERTLNDYFGQPKKINIFTGLSMYQEIERLHKGDENERLLKKEYENLISKYFFEGSPVELTPRISKDVIYCKLGEDKEYPIYNLGDGIQHLIIITFPLFINKSQDILAFIEEPELYLHPGLQRTLLNLLTSAEFGNLQTFITTHSNNFLDMVLDFDKISVYKFFKPINSADNNKSIMGFKVENTSNEDLNILECLGVKNSSVMLTNCTIWVEGITDRIYLRKYLEIYQKHLNEIDNNAKIYEEDKHYSFVEYSGNNITHWSFLDFNNEDEIEKGMNAEKLCAALFLIADRDNEGSEAKRERHRRLKAKLKDRYYRLKCREIENLLSKDILLKTISIFENCANDTGIMASNLKYDDYKLKPIGSFIEENILEGNAKRKYATKSGSLHGSIKTKFAKTAISQIKSINDLSKEAQSLCVKLYNFIAHKNN